MYLEIIGCRLILSRGLFFPLFLHYPLPVDRYIVGFFLSSSRALTLCPDLILIALKLLTYYKIGVIRDLVIEQSNSLAHRVLLFYTLSTLDKEPMAFITAVNPLSRHMMELHS